MSIDAMKQALEALEMYLRLDTVEDSILLEQVIAPEAITALRAAIDQAMAGKPKTRSQKIAEAGYKRRPSAKSLPSDE